MKNQLGVSRRQVITSVGTGVAVAVAGCSGGSENGPETVVENFFTAVDSGNVAEANDYYLDETGQADRPVEQQTVSINSIDEQSIEEVADTAPSVFGGGDVSVDEVEEYGNQIATHFDHSESEWKLVYFDVEIGGVPEENYSWVVKTEDGWKIGRLAMFGA